MRDHFRSADHFEFDIGMSDWFDIVLRLSVATLIGASIGLNRELHGKPTGLRTLALVGLGAAVVVRAGLYSSGEVPDPNAESRVIQGVITGIGFLGAGVIIRGSSGTQVHGLTTAATIWVTACLGLMSGLGAWRELTVAVSLVAFILLLGGPIEKFIHSRFTTDLSDGSDGKSDL